MKAPAQPTQRIAAGRPRTSALTRAEQLRVAKQAQRARDSSAGHTDARIKLPTALAERLVLAARQPGFIDALTKLLEATVVEVDRYPQLKLLCWNRRVRYLAAEDAWSLYERNRRFVEPDQLDPCERVLIESLSVRYGDGRRRD